MRYSRKRQLITILLLVMVIASLSVGFAAFSASLTISSSASVTPDSNSFKVYFSKVDGEVDDSPVEPSFVSDGVIATSSAVINNSSFPTLSNVNATFSAPGQYVEYSLYVLNRGEYTAYLNGINFFGDKVCTYDDGREDDFPDDVCDSLQIYVDYDGSRFYDENDLKDYALKKNESVKISVGIGYDSDGAVSSHAFSVKFPDVVLVFSTVNQEGYVPPNVSGGSIPGTLLSAIKNDSQFLGTDEWVDFTDMMENGLFIRSGTENHINPIYYYRGEIENNYIIFANYCWKIVRTTETGGVKLIYNGDATPSGTGCAGDVPIIKFDTYNNVSETIDNFNYLYADGSSSSIKRSIDNWYENNLMDYTDMLDDTVWCNDRSVLYDGYDDEWGYDVKLYGGFLRNERNIHPSFQCSAENSLSVGASNISNKLKYPIGLLTADELTFAGSGVYGYSEDAFLNTLDWWWWTMTPAVFEDGNVNAYTCVADGYLVYRDVGNQQGVRPSISLKGDIQIVDGDGTYYSPYLVE